MLSALLILAGLVLLLPSVSLWNVLTTGSTGPSGSSSLRFASAATGTSSNAAVESLVGFGAVGLGLILEVFSLFTDVGGRVPQSAVLEGKTGEEKEA